MLDFVPFFSCFFCRETCHFTHRTLGSAPGEFTSEFCASLCRMRSVDFSGKNSVLFYSVLPVSFLPSLSQWLLTCSNNILTSLKKRRKKYPNFCVYHLTKVLDVLRISSPLSLSFFFFLVTCIFESVFWT